jgi:hypothetical protein
LFIKTSWLWQQAKDYCRAYAGGDIAYHNMDNLADRRIIVENVPGMRNHGAKIGLHKIGGEWRYLDGSVPKNPNWAADQPHPINHVYATVNSYPEMSLDHHLRAQGQYSITTSYTLCEFLCTA